MIAFGIDPGSHRTGWGVIRVEGTALSCIDSGVISTPSEAALSTRCELIFRELRVVIEVAEPDHVFLESIFHAKNARSALVLGHARGVALLAASMSGCPIDEIAPADVKKAVTGNGRADKRQVQDMVRTLLGMASRAPSDAADALAVAIAGSSRVRSPIHALLAKGARTS